MAADPRRRQKKLERRNAKRREKKHSLVRQQHAGIGGQLAAATKYPVLHSWVTEDFWTKGMGWALLSRQLPDGSIAVGVFLVDRYCLGVKDALANIVGRYTYDMDFVRKIQSQFSSREVSPATVRKLVEAAVAYAAGLGLPPHPDYHKARMIFGSIDPRESPEEFEFGKDGKPYFVAGPSDTPQRCRQIVAILTHSCGPDGFRSTIPMATSDDLMPSGDEGEYGDLIDFDEIDEP
jgi:hypothetical protein